MSATQSSPLITSSPGPLSVPGLSEIPKKFSSFSVKLVEVRGLAAAAPVVFDCACAEATLTNDVRTKMPFISLFMEFLPGTGAGLDEVSAEQHAKYVIVSDDPDLGVLPRYSDQHSLVTGIANEVSNRILAVPYKPIELPYCRLLVRAEFSHSRKLLGGD